MQFLSDDITWQHKDGIAKGKAETAKVWEAQKKMLVKPTFKLGDITEVDANTCKRQMEIKILLVSKDGLIVSLTAEKL